MKQTLIDILNIPSTCENNILLSHYILNTCSTLKLKEIKIDGIGNILITKGNSEIYPCVTAHLDTIFDYKEVNVWEKDGILHSRTGIGGDDKCGIFICLELLKVLPALKVAFFMGEENGCEGSDRVNLNWFKNCGYIIALDRNGNSDYINNYWGSKTTSKKFNKTIRNCISDFGYKSTEGIITDVFNLIGKKINLSCCNLSSGYYLSHTKDEFVIIKDVFKALDLVKNMIDVLGCKKYEFCYKSQMIVYYQHSTQGNSNWWDKDTKNIENKKDFCDFCDEQFFDEELTYVEHAGLLCESCLYKVGLSKEIQTTEVEN